MPQLAAVEGAFQLVVQVPVGYHIVGDGVTLLHGLLYDKVGVSVDHEVSGSAVFGHSHAVD